MNQVVPNAPTLARFQDRGNSFTHNSLSPNRLIVPNCRGFFFATKDRETGGQYSEFIQHKSAFVLILLGNIHVTGAGGHV